MGKLARDKHSSLLRKLVNYGRKMFYYMWPGASSKIQTYNHRIKSKVFYHIIYSSAYIQALGAYTPLRDPGAVFTTL
jgi:hypothetical protein